MFTQIKAFFGIGLGISLIVESLTAKNQALDNQMQALLLDRNVAQQAADKNQREVVKLRRDALVKVKEVRTVIQDEDCYSQPLPDSVIERMHYN